VSSDVAQQEHHHINYVKIWAILVALLIVSVIGPFVGTALNAQWLTLMTAFGIAIVKAYLVARNFMHINLEKKFVAYLIVTMLVLMALFFGGISPDVMKHDGQRWENVAAKAETARRMAAEGEGSGHGEHGEHGAPAEHGEHAKPAHE
jgi:caa(3)-type oxidase subunit IV